MNSNGNFLTGLICGAAAGLAIGILIAPDKGSETRKSIMNKASDLSDKFKSAASDAVDKLKEMGNAVSSDYDKSS